MGSHAPDKVLLILCVLLFAKCLWAVAKPGSLKRVTAWWAEAAMKVNTLTGLLCAMLALAVWGLVLVHQPMTSWLLTGLGAVFAWWAVLYLRPPSFQKILDAWIIQPSERRVRITFCLMAVAAFGGALVALRGILQ